MKHPPITESTNRKYWENFSDDELDDYIENLFTQARIHGFPYHTLKPSHKKEIEKLLKKNYLAFINDGKISQHMGGLGFLWSFFHHAWEVSCGKGKTPMENFLDDDSLKIVIRKRLEAKWAGNFSLPMLYKSLRMFNGAQSVSNFRPTAASAVYSYVSAKYFDGNTIKVLDTSAGWGGRLLGAFLSRRVSKYSGFEPSKKSYSGLCNVRLFLHENFHHNCNIYLINKGSEEIVLPDDDVFDFVFTSPPYYNTEKYSDEPTQSWIKFPCYNSWLDGFMRKTCINIKAKCHSETIVAWNVANVKTAPTLIDDVDVIMKGLGFDKIDKLDYLMSGRPQKSSFKSEPIIFYKQKE